MIAGAHESRSDPPPEARGRLPAVVAFKNVSLLFAPRSGPAAAALRDVTLNIAQKKVTGLVGPGGAGKTSLLRLVAGLIVPTSGSIAISSVDAAQLTRSARCAIGYMPQRFGLYDDLTVRENLHLVARLCGVPAAMRRDRVEEMLELLGLSRFGDNPAIQLSGGMRQKLALGGVLLRNGDLILLDEPTVGVDPLTRLELWRLVKSLPEKASASVIVATSHLAEAAQCDDVVLLDGGCVVAQDTPENFAARLDSRVFETRFTDAASIAGEGILHASAYGQRLRLIAETGASLADSALQPAQPRCEDALLALLCERRPEKRAQSAPEPIGRAFRKGGPFVELHDVSHWYGDLCAVRKVSFSVDRGEIFGLIGANGAGKSTIIKLLCGLQQATEGTVSFVARDPEKEFEPLQFGYVAQRFNLYSGLTVRQNLHLFAAAYGIPACDEDARVSWAIACFGLGGVVEAAAGELPRNLSQRLALACALLHEPEILFLDEPTSGVDTLARGEFWRWIREISARGATIIVCTHFMEEADRCDRVAIMDAGEIIAIGSPHDVAGSGDSQTRQPTLEEMFVDALRARASVGRVGPDVSIPAFETATSRFRDHGFDRVCGLALKEIRLILRDPGSLLLAFAMPLLLLVLFGFGVSLDPRQVPITVVAEQTDMLSQSLAGAFRHSKYFDLSVTPDMRQALASLQNHRALGVVRLRPTSDRDLLERRASLVQLILDGADANTARLAESYVHGALSQWNVNWIRQQENKERPPIFIEPQIWYNRNTHSSYYLILGLIALLMTLTGTLLPALSTARELEAGTFEALRATAARPVEIVLGRLLPYYVLAMLSAAIAVTAAIGLFGVPLRGSAVALFVVGSLFSCGSVGFGILVANRVGNQFLAALIAIVGSFMPAFLLSGFIFDLHSMPWGLRAITNIVPARYLVDALQTLFLVGTTRSVTNVDMVALGVIAIVFLGLSVRSTK